MALDYDVMRQRLAQAKEADANKGGSGPKLWRPKAGLNVVRIMPHHLIQEARGATDWALPVWFHYNIGDQKDSFLCLKTLNKHCPICDLSDQLKSHPNQDLRTVGYNMRAKQGFNMFLIDRKEPAKGAQLAALAQTVYFELLSYFLDPQWGDFTDPNTGYDITIERDAVVSATMYHVRPSPQKTLVTTNPQEWQILCGQVTFLLDRVQEWKPEEVEKAVAPIRDMVKLGYMVTPTGQHATAPVGYVPAAAAPAPIPMQAPPLGAPAAAVAPRLEIPGATTAAPVMAAPPVAGAASAPALTVPKTESPFKAPPVAAAAPVAASVPAAVKTGNAPADLPPDLQVCWATQHDPNDQECMICAFEGSCAPEMARRGTK